MQTLARRVTVQLQLQRSVPLPTVCCCIAAAVVAILFCSCCTQAELLDESCIKSQQAATAEATKSNGAFTISVAIMNYVNAQHRLHDSAGTCGSGTPAACNPQFTVSLVIGGYQRSLQCAKSPIFNSTARIVNPLSVNFTAPSPLPTNMALTTSIEHVNSIFGNHLISKQTHVIDDFQSDYIKISGDVKYTLLMRIFCASNFYGSNCSLPCAGKQQITKTSDGGFRYQTDCDVGIVKATSSKSTFEAAAAHAIPAAAAAAAAFAVLAAVLLLLRRRRRASAKMEQSNTKSASDSTRPAQAFTNVTYWANAATPDTTASAAAQEKDVKVAVGEEEEDVYEEAEDEADRPQLPPRPGVRNVG